MRVSLLQMPADAAAASPDPVHLVRGWVTAAAGSDLIVLPEMWHPGYFAFDQYARAAGDTPELLAALSETAAEAGACLHAGSLVEADDGRLYNTSVLFGPDGTELARYRKMHLFGFDSQEQRLLSPGEEVVVADTPLGRLGMAVCYDLRFPELFRRMCERGAVGFVVASAWPHPRVEAWSTLLRARAIENQAFVFACNGVGATGYGATLCGRSAVIDPWGITVASLGDDPGIASVPVQLQEARTARGRFPALADRQLLGDPDNDLVLRQDDGTAVRFTARRVILAGYTARDTDATNAYIAKLEEEGIAPPDEVPAYFVVGVDRLTTASRIEVTTASSCGEVEFALLIDDDEVWVAAASDHTDRALEAVDINASKQNCPKVLSSSVWRLSDIEAHWDALAFEARTPAGATDSYQAGPVAALRPPRELIELVEDRFGGSMAGTVILSGTIPAAGGFEFHPSFEVALRDPVRGRSLEVVYSIVNVMEDT